MIDLRLGNVLDVLQAMDAESVHCIVTSPPYWGLRAYGTEPQVWRNGSEPCQEHQWGDSTLIASQTQTDFAKSGLKRDGRPEANRVATNEKSSTRRANPATETNTCTRCGAWRGELGLEPTPELYVDHIVQIMREARRVLRGDGTLWLNIGDSYVGSTFIRECASDGWANKGDGDAYDKYYAKNGGGVSGGKRRSTTGLKVKDLCGIPWRIAFALQADGWYLRSDIIWHKPNPMPESVRDRPTKAHEYLFLLAKQTRYYYDADAVREPHTEPWRGKGEKEKNNWSVDCKRGSHETVRVYNPAGRNRRSVWTVTTQPYSGAHFATFPPKLIEPCILAATSARGVCSKCGAPWVRVVEHRYAGRLDAPKREQAKESIDPAQRQWKHCHATKETDTLGWRASCACDAGEPVPATVLDPFNGAGTTGLVAVKHRRNYIGIDLKPEYLEMTRKRLDGVQMVTG